MREYNQLNIKELFNLAFQNQKQKNFKVAISQYKKIIEIEPNLALVYYNLGLIYEQLEETEVAIKNYKKSIKVDPLFFHSHNNLGILFQKQGEKERAIENFKKVIETNSQYLNAYNNLGLVYSSLGHYKEAIDSFIKTLELDKNNSVAIKGLIYLLTYYSANNAHPLIVANNHLKQIQKQFKFNDLLKIKNLSYILKETYKIMKKYNNEFENFQFIETQSYRRNTLDLNCGRHHKVFENSNIIPKFCFNCFKIQIEPENVIELIKLFFIFDSLELPKNNQRKCMVELRNDVSGLYKGIIYCSNVEEAKNILEDITPILNLNLKYKVSIKRGCSEFYKSFSNFNIVDKKNINFMNYPEKWEKIEQKAKIRKNYNTIKINNTVSGMSISDFLVINQWLNYAKKIDDQSYKKIGFDTFNSQYISEKMLNQVEFRRKEFKY
ncbi:tetratricopeptide repeat protein [Candidatus Pelagibacter sp.]|nr:tetratricopeptide repeat protein [Candidatus Pelagibacter sp.]